MGSKSKINSCGVSSVVTQSLTDFGPFKNPDFPETEFMKIPAVLLCYWLGKFESQKKMGDELKLLF